MGGYQVGFCDWMMTGEWGLATEGIWVSQAWGFTCDVDKENDKLEPVGWMARRKRGATGEFGVSQAMGWGQGKQRFPLWLEDPFQEKVLDRLAPPGMNKRNTPETAIEW